VVELQRSGESQEPPATGGGIADSASLVRHVLTLPTVGAEPWHLELALRHPPDRDERAYLDAVVRQAGQTLERLALREAERRARADERLVSEAAALLSQSLDVDDVVEQLCALVVPSFADACEVTLTGPDADARHREDGDDATPGGGHGAAAELLIPLRSRDRRIGTMIVRRAHRGFDEHDRSIAHQLASRGAQALDNALLFDAQARVRTTLERSLLPLAMLPVDNLALAARYFPGSLGSDVGGDFYDAVRRRDGSTVLIIGDVQGKGAEAAGMTAVARHTLRSTALEGAGPATMLTQLNQALLYGHAELALARDDDPRFVTAAAVAIEPYEDGFVAVGASGGHPPPLVVRADGTTEYLPARGPLLGFFDEPRFHEASTVLRERDTIVLYTDGVTELRHGTEWFDDVELGRLLHNRRAPVDAEAIAQLIEDTVLVITGGTVRDDIAILVASVL
jgi:serine phosphatase RsbU (regulator of sigma subunit)